ncbi:MAG: hypothetical protein J5I59_07060 [Saprospiraceae bacterium]|nr:hypothetical protein [Saprospiraceae bacterium]
MKKIILFLQFCFYSSLGIGQTQYYANSYHQFNTLLGFVRIGIGGQEVDGKANFFTDQTAFLFNKPILATNGFLSYNSTLNLEAASGYFIQLQPRNTSFGLMLKDYLGINYGNIKVNSDGLGFGYNSSNVQFTVSSNGKVNILNDKPNSTICLSDGTGNVMGKPRLILHQRNDIPHAFIYFNQNLYFISDGEGSNSPLVLQYDGSVGIGFPSSYTSGTNHTNGYKLAVNGSMHSKSLDIDMQNWPDFVFEPNYKLRTLKEVEIFINEYGHLPEIPCSVDVEKEGINVGEIQSKLLQKIEELTLYIIEIDKKNIILENKIMVLENKLINK